MNDQWRTSTVVGLCATMRQTNEYSNLGLGMLADALADAGCTDETMLTQLRRPDDLDAIAAQRLVALAYSNETAVAVEWLERFAAGLQPDGYNGEGVRPDYPWLMGAAQLWIEHEDYTTQNGSAQWRATGVPDEFWDHYETVVGKVDWGESHWSGGPRPRGGSFFSCSC